MASDHFLASLKLCSDEELLGLVRRWSEITGWKEWPRHEEYVVSMVRELKGRGVDPMIDVHALAEKIAPRSTHGRS